MFIPYACHIKININKSYLATKLFSELLRIGSHAFSPPGSFIQYNFMHGVNEDSLSSQPSDKGPAAMPKQ
jgi:hypothetical protein